MRLRIGREVAGLATDLCLPPHGSATTVLVRTPYGTAGLWPEAAAYVDAGYAVVLQDVRGRFRSSGAFVAGADETADGHATVDWIVDQPWSDGRVVLAGVGYEAYTAWCATDHPAVSAVISRQPWPPGDAFPPLDAELWWRTEHGVGRTGYPGLTEFAAAASDVPLDDQRLADQWPVDIRPWPPQAGDWTSPARRVEQATSACRVPSLHIGSWYCRSVVATLRHAVAAADATCVVGGWVSPLTQALSPECAIDVPVTPDPLTIALDWLGGKVDRPRTLWLGSGRWREHSPVPVTAPTQRLITASAPVTLTANPAQPYPSLPHSADLSQLAGTHGSAEYMVDGPLSWHGQASCVVSGHASTASQLIATLVHETPAGVRTVLTDGIGRVAGGSWTIEITCRPVAVDLPRGHRLRLQLTTSRYPRYPRAPRPATITIDALGVHAPSSEGR